MLIFEMLEGRPPFRDPNESRPEASAGSTLQRAAVGRPTWEALPNDHGRTLLLRACPEPRGRASRAGAAAPHSEVHSTEATSLVRELLTPDLALRLKSAASVKARMARDTRDLSSLVAPARGTAICLATAASSRAGQASPWLTSIDWESALNLGLQPPFRPCTRAKK